MTDSNWRGQAACRGVDPELFFPESPDKPLVRKQVAAAKAVCRGCHVRDRCLADALLRLPHGIAGGLTEQERRRVRSVGSLAKADTPKWQALLDAGRSHPEMAHECGVTVRTVHRWVSRLHEEVASGRGDPR